MEGINQMENDIQKSADKRMKDYFFKQVDVNEGGCWLWKKCEGKDKYGMFNGESAHRASYRIFKGIIPDNKMICHKCPGEKDNKNCVCPDHLYAGTGAENTRDVYARRDSNINKLTENDILEIKEIRKSAMYFSNKDLAIMFNVSHAKILEVVNDIPECPIEQNNSKGGV